MKQSSAKIAGHPCFNKAASHWFNSIHLPVAPRCNIKCYYCTKRNDCPNENLPGTASRVLTPSQAIKKVRKAVQNDPHLKVVGIAGPGDPLANKQTFQTLRLVHDEFPGLIKCVSTNGLLLAEKAGELIESGVTTTSVTVNAIAPRIASVIHAWIHYRGEVYEDDTAASILIENQLAGIKEAVSKGLTVKVNFILIPGLNENHIRKIAVTVRNLGVYMMNIIPLVPEAEFKFLQPPTLMQLAKAREYSAAIIPYMCNCIQSQGDTVGNSL